MKQEELEKRYPIVLKDGTRVTELTVCKSGGGYFIGRYCWDSEGQHPDQFSRESEYFPSKEAAEKALKEGFRVRSAMENDWQYEHNGLPRPGSKPVFEEAVTITRQMPGQEPVTEEIRPAHCDEAMKMAKDALTKPRLSGGTGDLYEWYRKHRQTCKICG